MSIDLKRRMVPFAACSIERVARVISRAFHHSDDLTATWTMEIAGEIKNGDLDSELSVACWEGDEVTGAGIVSALNNKEVRIPTLGVLPDRQRHGVGRDVVSEIIERAKKLGYSDLWLEVSSDNAKAIAFWKSMDMSIGRTLIRLRGDKLKFHPRRGSDAVQVGPSAVHRVLFDFEAFHSHRPVSTLTKARLERQAQKLKSFEMHSGGERIGYILLRGSRVEDLGIRPDSIRYVSALIAAAFEQTKSLTLYGWPQDDRLIPELLSHGFSELGSSVEAHRSL